ncbi:MAG: ChbG/HpnK family deacetylase, partial [Chloroflexi bacterium]|nr:ChbG/HpnK family deacetylase [Chloroflexota bacterium]
MVARSLIVNADDFGQSPGVNRGVFAAHERGIVTSASLMVRWPAAAKAAAYARERPELSLGLHVDLGEWAYRHDTWVPVYAVVPTDDPTAVAAEVAHQLATFRRLAGRDPTHVDSHQHVHRSEPVHSVLAETA